MNGRIATHETRTLPHAGFHPRRTGWENLTQAYDARPPYQRNDYIGWITRAKLPVTREKRLNQMLEELAKGDVYMKMAYRPKSKIK